MRSISARSMCRWMSSSSVLNSKLALLNLLANGLQALLNLSAFVGGQQAHFGKHLGMGDRRADVVRVEPPVEADAFGELLDAAVRRFGEDSGPSFVRPRRTLQRCRTRQASGANLFTVNGLGKGVNERRHCLSCGKHRSAIERDT